MAFLSKVGNILRQTATKQISNELSASRPSMFQAIRFMSSSKVFVGGISYQTDDTSLREAFGKYGEVIEARVIIDRETGRSRGFAFVTYTSSEEASSAIQALDGQDLHGRRVRVNYANDRPRSNFGGGGGYGGGGYGGGGYGGGAGGFGGGGYATGGGYGGGGGGYDSNYGGSYGGSGGNYGDGNTSGGGGDNSGGNVGYASGNNLGSASTGGYSSGTFNYGSGGGDVAGGNTEESVGGGSVNFGGSNDENAGFGTSGGAGGFGDSSGGFEQDRDDDDTDDFAKRA